MKIKGAFVFLPRYGKGGVGKTWMAQWAGPGGRPIRRSTGTRDKDAALRFLHTRLAEGLEPFKFRREQKGDRTMVGHFLNRHLIAQRAIVTRSTFERYKFAFLSIIAKDSPLRNLTFRQLDAAKVSEYVSYRLQKGVSKPTVMKEIVWLKGALREARLKRLLSVEVYQDILDTVSPRRHSGLRGASKPRDRYLTPREIEAITRAIPAGNDNLRDAFLLALHTGLRQENILTLTEGQVTLAEPLVLRFQAKDMKSGRSHVLTLGPQASEVIRRRCSMDPTARDRRLFHDFRPAWKRLTKRLEEAGTVQDIRFHDLRRTFATYRLAAGADVRQVQHELSHTDPRLTLRVYSQAIPPDVRAFALAHFRWEEPMRGQANLALRSL